jgi:hypothetical protein
MTSLPSAELDLVRFAYVVKARLDELDLSFEQARRLTGLSKRQLSHACNGKAICAGATHVLAALCDIDLDTMLPVETQTMLHRVRRLRMQMDELGIHAGNERNQTVTPPDPRETGIAA